MQKKVDEAILYVSYWKSETSYTGDGKGLVFLKN